MKTLESTRSGNLLILAVAGVLMTAITYGFQQRGGTSAKSSPFSEQRAATDLRVLVGFGPRPAGSEAITRARSYIVTELEKAGLKPELDSFEVRTPLGPRKMVNIRAIRRGSR